MPATTISIKVSDRLKGGGDVTAVREGSSARRVITAVSASFTIVTAIRSKLFSNSDILWFLTSLVLPIYPFFYHILKKHIKKQILKEILD
jgi:hypothetical protein